MARNAPFVLKRFPAQQMAIYAEALEMATTQSRIELRPPVRVPQPARYFLHKLAVADLRSGAENPKVEKDVIQAGILAVILATDDVGALEEAVAAVPKPMMKHLRKTLPKLARTLGDDHAAAAAVLHQLLGAASPAP